MLTFPPLHGSLARPQRRRDPLLALTAEALLGAQLVVRHRAPPVALAIAGCVAALVASAGAWTADDPSRGARHLALAVGLAGAVAAVAGARILAPGPALHSARYIGVSPACTIAGRLLGAIGMLAAPGLGLMVVLLPHDVGVGALAATLAGECAALALSAGATPFLGVMPGSVLSVSAALVVVTRPAVVGSTAWMVLCAVGAVAGVSLARTALWRRRAPRGWR